MFRYWEEKARDLQCDELYLLSKVARLAVIDFLREPEDFDQRGQNLVPAHHRSSAYGWLFEDHYRGVPLSDLCAAVGPDIVWLRQVIMEAALFHEMIPMDDFHLDRYATVNPAAVVWDIGNERQPGAHNEEGEDDGDEEGTW